MTSKLWFLQVPAFEAKDGKCLAESNAISYYGEFCWLWNLKFDGCLYRFVLIVANEQLRGKSDLEKAQILQWLDFADNEIVPGSNGWTFPLLGIMPYNKQVSKACFYDEMTENYKRFIFPLSKFVSKFEKYDIIL